MSYIVTDIETIGGSKADLELEGKLLKLASNIKDPAKIEKNLADKRAALAGKAALLDSAPIACIGIKTPTVTACFTSFHFDESPLIIQAGIACFTSDNEKQMLETTNEFLDMVTTPDMKMVSFNGVGFDLPKIRFRYAKHGIEPALPFGPYYKHVDLMLRYSKYYSMNKVPFVSMDEVIQRLGIADGKMMSGKYFGKLLDDGEYLKAVLYNVLDLMFIEQILFRIG